MACKDCSRARKEYGSATCSAHYDSKKDNARSMRQTGKPVASAHEAVAKHRAGGPYKSAYDAIKSPTFAAAHKAIKAKMGGE